MKLQQIFNLNIFLLYISPSLCDNSTTSHSNTQEYELVTQRKRIRAPKVVPYIPGQLTVRQNGLLLSTGLRSKIIAQSGKPVPYTGKGNNDRSKIPFHSNPDAGDCFPHPNGGWVYVSNAEVGGSKGGVGALTFDKNGLITNYEMILENTSRNCGGGKTPWNTWISCEENGSSGHCWECDPLGEKSANRTDIGGSGGNFESFAYDDRNTKEMRFYVTEDAKRGPLRMFKQSRNVVLGRDKSEILTTPGRHRYLVLLPEGDGSSGRFTFQKTREWADRSAEKDYPYSEGISVKDGKLYFTAKKNKHLFILDLDERTYVRSSTESGAFNGGPDQVKHILGGDDDDQHQILYFCEDSGSSPNSGVYGRDGSGKFFTILDGPGYDSETTGLAFSPDRKHMYVSYQINPGVIFDITRIDGKGFDGKVVNINYHEFKEEK